MKIKTAHLNRKIHIKTLSHNGRYICHITYHREYFMQYLANLADIIRTLGVTSAILLGLACWLVFSAALLGCTNPAQDPSEPANYSAPTICGKTDSTVFVFSKTYRPGKTKKATVYIDADGALWLRWPDGVQKSYDEGTVYLCRDPNTLWEIREDLRGDL